jgi:predicted SAM-dependent methyltransferase
LERLPGGKLLVRIATGTGPLFPSNALWGDVTRRLAVSDSSADGVFCSHTLEHLSSQDVDRALQEALRILKPGGVFRIVVPDLRWRAEAYLRQAAAKDERAADQFLSSTMLGEKRRARTLAAIARTMFGNSAHRWMFDFASLARRLTSIGFVDVRRCEFGDAAQPAFKDVEERSRFFAGENRELAVEARRPS